MAELVICKGYIIRDGRKIAVEVTEQRQQAHQAKSWHRRFVLVPWLWVERLQKATRPSTFKLALLLLYEHWRAKRQSLVLSNVFVESEGLSRSSKWNAIRELEGLGLVRVECHKGRSPRLVLLRL